MVSYRPAVARNGQTGSLNGTLYNRTPLMLAAMNGRLDTVKLPVTRAAAVGLKDSQGMTALDHAERRERRQIAVHLRR